MTDVLTPNYVTIDPATGKIGANFTGVINAEGLNLPSGTSQVLQPANQIIWKPGPNGALIATIGAFVNAGDDSEVSLAAYSPNVGGGGATAFSGATVAAGDAAQNIWAKLAAQVETIGGAANSATLVATAQRAGGPFQQAVILTDTGASDFIQNGSGVQALKITAGSGTVTFGGGSPTSGVTTIPTGCPFVTQGGCLVGQSTPTNAFQTYTWSATYAGGNPMNFNIAANSSTNGTPSAGLKVNFFWLAFGF